MVPVKNLTASVLARLRNKAREAGRPFDQILTYYTFERFLFRLSRSKYRDQFILKGALLMMAWPVGLARSTSDIDFRAFVSPDVEELSRVIGEVCMVAVQPDAVEFDAANIQVEQVAERFDNLSTRIRPQGLLISSQGRVKSYGRLFSIALIAPTSGCCLWRL